MTGLRASGLIRDVEPQFTELGGGVSSDLVLVRDRTWRFVVKRALSQLRVRDDWFADVTRNQVERTYLEQVAFRVPEAVPRVLGGDAEAGWFAMEYFGEGYFPWNAALLRGEAEPAIAAQAGRILGRIHRLSWGDPGLAARFATTGNFEQLRIDPYLRITAARVPAVRTELTKEADRLAGTRLALVHGDYSPKNLLWGEGRVIVLDAECG